MAAPHTRFRCSGSSVTSTTRPSPLLSLHLPACEVVAPGELEGERRNLTRVLAATMNGPWKDRLCQTQSIHVAGSGLVDLGGLL
jgi:hypothetical protein